MGDTRTTAATGEPPTDFSKATPDADAERKTAINKRVQRRYDELRLAAKHGIYETIFRIVHEERGAAVREAHDLLADLLAFAKDAPPALQKRAADLLAGIEGGRP